MDAIDPQTALTLLRTIPGEARVLQQVKGDPEGGSLGLIFQFDNGIEISWSCERPGPHAAEVVADDAGLPEPAWGFRLRARVDLAESWRAWRESRMAGG